MKPYQLIDALMQAEGIGALPLAKKLGNAKLQPLIHRFINGDVDAPKVTTAGPLAVYFKLPLEALYDEKRSTAIAKERGIKAPPPRSAAGKRKAAIKDDDEVAKFAAKYAAMNPTERQKLRLLMLVAREGVNPTNFPSVTGDSPPAQADPATDGSSGLMDMDHPSPKAPKAIKRG